MATTQGAAMSRSPAPIVIKNEGTRVVLSPENGAVVQLENLPRQIQLVSLPTTGIPWRVEILDDAGTSRWIDAYSRFAWQLDDAENAVHLMWTTELGLTVEANVRAPRSESHVSFEIAVRGTPGVMIDKVEFPIISGIGDLRTEAESILVHSQATGFLFHQPYALFDTEPLRRQGLRYSPYPEGYNGSTMQFMAYYASGVGGFLMRTTDAGGDLKWFNFFKSQTGALECSFMHQAADIRAGESLIVPYPVLFEPLHEGAWQEAAELYKVWAIRQPWTAQGTLVERADRPTWLLDEVGFATFGVNAARDRAKWLDRFHQITGEPVFHILGVNWPKETTGYGRGHPGGADDWFPARFSAENLTTIKGNGDYWAPFEFDLLLDVGKSESDRVHANLVQLPVAKYSFDTYPFSYQCAATEYLPALHRWRDATLAGEYGADALYYDISAPNVIPACMNPSHGHPIGGGGWMVEAVARMWRSTGEAAADAKGSHVPQGAEMVHELFIPYLDFYQARAEASPLSVFEADIFREWIRENKVEKIPLFAYVYHEYGPVRLDGWAKLSREIGDLFYWVASRVALWGGLFELNYEFSDLEVLEDLTDDPSEHYATIEARAFEVDPAKVEFVREIAKARVGYARPWLVYGTMVRPLEHTPPQVDLNYHLYNLDRHHLHFDEQGTMRVEGVVHAAWRAPDWQLGFAFVNLFPNEPLPIHLTIDPSRYGISSDQSVDIVLIGNDAPTNLFHGKGVADFDVLLPPRRVVVVRVTPEAVT